MRGFIRPTNIASQKIALQIAEFSNRILQIATLTAGSAEKSRNEIANRCVSKTQFQIAVFFAFKTARTGRILNRRDFLGVRFRIATFPHFGNQRFRDAKASNSTIIARAISVRCVHGVRTALPSKTTLVSGSASFLAATHPSW